MSCRVCASAWVSQCVHNFCSALNESACMRAYLSERQIICVYAHVNLCACLSVADMCMCFHFSNVVDLRCLCYVISVNEAVTRFFCTFSVCVFVVAVYLMLQV